MPRTAPTGRGASIPRSKGLSCRMFEEIRPFFDRLRKQPQPEWPKNLSAIDPDFEMELLADSEKHWRLAMECLDEMEVAIVQIYDAGADDPVAIDLLDEIVSLIRGKGTDEVRLAKIAKLLRERLSS
jgi:hypothetical protein